jgi:hypothetical protein
MRMTTPHKPQTKQRSKFRSFKDDDPITTAEITRALEGAGATNIDVWHRNVSDGYLRVIIDEEPLGWHLSISHAKRGKGGQLGPGRYPKWDEIAHARFEFLPHELDFVMHLPPPEEYMALHDTTFHLHEYPDRELGGPKVVTDGKTPLLERPSGLVVPG